MTDGLRRTYRYRLYWQALTDIAGYEGWQAGGVASVRVMGDIARAALAHFDPEGNR